MSTVGLHQRGLMLIGMASYLLFSHDGFGLGHVRRNCRIAESIAATDPDADITIASGLAVSLPWPLPDRTRLAPLVPLLKDTDGAYKNPDMGFDAALRDRRERFVGLVATIRPQVVLVDRHPYGIGGELADGLELAKSLGAVIVLGLRDVLDEPGPIHAEINGDGWARVADVFDQILVYGTRTLVDHQAEYGVPVEPTYCGWVTTASAPPRLAPRSRQLLVTAGGGGDGEALFQLTERVLTVAKKWRATVIAGPYRSRSNIAAQRRLTVIDTVPSYDEYYAQAAAVMQMAGYNSTAEAVAAGIKPILMPRRSPRREQAIRACRLAALGLADVVDQGADPSEVAWLLERPRHLAAGAAADAGIRFDGATTAAKWLVAAARSRVRP